MPSAQRLFVPWPRTSPRQGHLLWTLCESIFSRAPGEVPLPWEHLGQFLSGKWAPWRPGTERGEGPFRGSPGKPHMYNLNPLKSCELGVPQVNSLQSRGPPPPPRALCPGNTQAAWPSPWGSQANCFQLAGAAPCHLDQNRAAMVKRSAQASRFHVSGALGKGKFQTLKPQPARRSRPQLQQRADPERGMPVHFGEGPAAATAAEYSGGFLAWRRPCPQCLGLGGGWRVSSAPSPLLPRG